MGRLDRRTGSIGRQVQRWKVFELLFPVSDSRFIRPLVRPLSLPLSEVRVLDRQLRQRGWSSVGKCIVERREFLGQYRAGPTVENDVMSRSKKDVLVLAYPE